MKHHKIQVQAVGLKGCSGKNNQ